MTNTTEVGTTAVRINQAQERVRSASLGHVIGGVCEPICQRAQLEVIDPGSGRVIARISKGSAIDVDRAVAAAREAFPAWRATTPSARATTLTAVADAFDVHIEEFATLESLNAGKPITVARAEMAMIGDIFRFLSGAARAMHAPAPMEYVSNHFSMVVREPLGVVGAITPWNYPLLTAVFKIAAALAAGNAMVLKPSELTPLTSLRFMEIVSGILPPGVLNVVLGTGEEVGSAISRHEGIDMVSLTGSVSSGKQVVGDSAPTLKPTHLELGGKAPVIVFEDADLDAVIAGVRAAGFWNSGQECGSATRIICAERIQRALTDRLLSAVSTIKMGRAAEGDDIEMGPLISQRHLDLVSATVQRAKADGARILAGGQPAAREGFFFPPTIISDVARGSYITQHEIFGPVVTIETFKDERDAIKLANAVAYGLAASVWTQNTGRAVRVAGALNFGTVWVNAHLVLAVEMPWGGYKMSGHGRELSTLSLEDFSRTKHVMISTGVGQVDALSP